MSTAVEMPEAVTTEPSETTPAGGGVALDLVDQPMIEVT